MTATAQSTGEILVRDVRLAFPKGLFEKTSMPGDKDSKPRFNAKFILTPDHPQIGELRALEARRAKESWGDDWEKLLERARKTDDKHLLRDGDGQNYDGFAGMLFISAGADTRPSLYNRDRSPLTKEDGVIYGGCYGNVKLDVWAMNNSWGKRINATLLGFQFARDGDSFSAGAPPAKADDFPELDAGDDAPGVDPFA